MTNTLPTPLTNWQICQLIHRSRAFKGAERHLINALVFYTDIHRNYTCSPSYATLSQDTGLSEDRLRTAARTLESQGVIRRGLRANSSNVFKINIHQLLKLADAVPPPASKPKIRWAATKWPESGKFSSDLDNTDSPESAKHEANLEHTHGFTSQADEKRRETPHAFSRKAKTGYKDCADTELQLSSEDVRVFAGDKAAYSTLLPDSVEELVQRIREIWPNHAVWGKPSHVACLRSDLAACVKIAGTPGLCARLITRKARDPKLRALIATRNSLGAYLRKCVPGWMLQDGDVVIEIEDEVRKAVLRHG